MVEGLAAAVAQFNAEAPLAPGEDVIVMATFVQPGKSPGTALIQVGGLQTVVPIQLLGRLGPLQEAVDEIVGDAPATEPAG